MQKPWEYISKNVHVTCDDGHEITGKCVAYLSGEDNEPDPEALVIDYVEIPTQTIKNIRIIH